MFTSPKSSSLSIIYLHIYFTSNRLYMSLKSRYIYLAGKKPSVMRVVVANAATR